LVAPPHVQPFSIPSDDGLKHGINVPNVWGKR
jgi:hypothetical protein